MVRITVLVVSLVLGWSVECSTAWAGSILDPGTTAFTVAGGGSQRLRDGVVAGEAKLNPWTAAPLADGSVLLADLVFVRSVSGGRSMQQARLWRLGLDGRLHRVLRPDRLVAWVSASPQGDPLAILPSGHGIYRVDVRHGRLRRVGTLNDRPVPFRTVQAIGAREALVRDGADVWWWVRPGFKPRRVLLSEDERPWRFAPTLRGTVGVAFWSAAFGPSPPAFELSFDGTRTPLPEPAERLTGLLALDADRFVGWSNVPLALILSTGGWTAAADRAPLWVVPRSGPVTRLGGAPQRLYGNGDGSGPAAVRDLAGEPGLLDVGSDGALFFGGTNSVLRAMVPAASRRPRAAFDQQAFTTLGAGAASFWSSIGGSATVRVRDGRGRVIARGAGKVTRGRAAVTLDRKLRGDGYATYSAELRLTARTAAIAVRTVFEWPAPGPSALTPEEGASAIGLALPSAGDEGGGVYEEPRACRRESPTTVTCQVWRVRWNNNGKKTERRCPTDARATLTGAWPPSLAIAPRCG